MIRELCLGRKLGVLEVWFAIQLSTEHNANIDGISHELKIHHPDDPEIVVLKHGVWRVKGHHSGQSLTLSFSRLANLTPVDSILRIARS